MLHWCWFCFSLTFQSQAQPLSSLTPWLPSVSFLSGFFIPPYAAVDGTVPEKKKRMHEQREREGGRGGGSNHALSYFLNDGDQSRGADWKEQGQIEVFEDRGRQVHGSPDHLILPSDW